MQQGVQQCSGGGCSGAADGYLNNAWLTSSTPNNHQQLNQQANGRKATLSSCRSIEERGMGTRSIQEPLGFQKNSWRVEANASDRSFPPLKRTRWWVLDALKDATT